jgi:hypothetical protein
MSSRPHQWGGIILRDSFHDEALQAFSSGHVVQSVAVFS